MKSATQQKFSSSIIAWNEGDGKFKIQELPLEAQLSSVNAILCKDINNDEKLDIILGGNITECLPQFGRLDANYGIVLKNNGDKRFAAIDPARTGISVTGMVRDIALINGEKEHYILFLRNDEYPVMYRLNPQTP